MNRPYVGEWGSLVSDRHISSLAPQTISILNGAVGLVPIDFSKRREVALSDYLYNIWKAGLISEAEYNQARLDVLAHNYCDSIG